MRCGAYWLLDELAGILFLTAEMTGWLPRGVFGYASRSNNVRVLPDVSPVGEPLHEQNTCDGLRGWPEYAFRYGDRNRYSTTSQTGWYPICC